MTPVRQLRTTMLADTVASVTWSLTVGSGTEYLAGLSLEEMLRSRALNLTISAIWGRPAGKFKDYLWEKTGTTQESSLITRAAVDGAAYIISWIPTYAVAVYAAGARGETFEHAIYNCVAALAVMSIPYNWWQDRMRSAFGAKIDGNEALTEQSTLNTASAPHETAAYEPIVVETWLP
jgi:hypothetical protein